MCPLDRIESGSIAIENAQEQIPKGSLLNTYLPKGVMKVVRARDSSDKGICQKPQLASSYLNVVAPARQLSVSSTFGKG